MRKPDSKSYMFGDTLSIVEREVFNGSGQHIELVTQPDTSLRPVPEVTRGEG